MKTNVPEIEMTATGLKLPSELDILKGVLADFNTAFGGNLNLNLETPQGQLASSLAAIIADKNNQIAWLANQVHPDYAEGFMQDAIAKIYFLERKQATDSVVTCEFMGLAGTRIPKGFIVKDALGNNWVLQQNISILHDGKVTGTLSTKGNVSAKAHTVNQMYQTIVGLDRVDNPQDAIPGKLTESRAEFRDRRQRSVAINAHGTPQAVYANVFALDGVSDVYVVDNPKGEVVTLNGYRLKPHSICVSVVGGNNQQIAKTILQYAGNGCDFNGNTNVTVYDDNYSEPKPAYQVSFMRPVDLPIYFRVRVEQGAPIGYQDVIKQAIIAAFNGDNKARIGANIYAIRYVAPVVKAMPDAHVLDVEIGLAKSSMGNMVSVGIHQKPAISANNIEVIIDA